MPVFKDSPSLHAQLYPFTQTRKPEEIRIGILTIKEKYERLKKDGEIDPSILPGVINATETKQLNKIIDIVLSSTLGS